jgi:hypothetical protein
LPGAAFTGVDGICLGNDFGQPLRLLGGQQRARTASDRS